MVKDPQLEELQVVLDDFKTILKDFVMLLQHKLCEEELVKKHKKIYSIIPLDKDKIN